MADEPIDPDLAARLRELSEQRVAAKVQAAKQRADQRRDSRRQFAERRRVGVDKRHALKAARLQLAQHHQRKDQQP